MLAMGTSSCDNATSGEDVSGRGLSPKQHHGSSHGGHAEVFEEGDGGERDAKDGAHAGAVEVETFAERFEDAEGTEEHDADGEGVNEGGLPVREVAESQAELDEGIEVGVGPERFGEEVVHLEAVGEAFQVEEFEHGKDDEEEAHEVVHPGHPIPTAVGDLLGAGGEEAEGDDGDEGDVVGPLCAAAFLPDFLAAGAGLGPGGLVFLVGLVSIVILAGIADEFLAALVAAKEVGFALVLDTKRGGFVDVHAADGVGGDGFHGMDVAARRRGVRGR